MLRERKELVNLRRRPETARKDATQKTLKVHVYALRRLNTKLKKSEDHVFIAANGRHPLALEKALANHATNA